MNTSHELGKLLFDIDQRTMGRTPRDFNGLSARAQERWIEDADEFLREAASQSSQHFSRLAELVVHELQVTLNGWTIAGEARAVLDKLFSLLPDPDAKLKDTLKRTLNSYFNGLPLSDSMAEEIISYVREHDAKSP